MARMGSLVVFFCFAVMSRIASADGGPFGIDHYVRYDNSGIWKRSNQVDLAAGTELVLIGGALWEGDDNKLGDTFWRSIDSTVLAIGSSQVLKFAFSRERPSQTTNPNKFFAGHGSDSFPSEEVAEISAAVTPFIFEYGADHPAIYGLALLPVYDAIARVKVHGHWQSDVIAGAALGAGWGWYASQRDKPLVLSFLPGGLMVGLKKDF
jgi:acid phosphatase family membrane protein YuiD